VGITNPSRRLILLTDYVILEVTHTISALLSKKDRRLCGKKM